jgi:prevent-host-death family protein
MQQINLTEASEHLPDLIEAALTGEEIVIIKDNQPVVKLVPVSQ